ncbi:MAG: adenylyltransferase/cytidyltransferase family protein [Patescibacteria group bacterium]
MAFSVAERITLAVLAYSTKFGYPLTETEIITRAFKPHVLFALENNKDSIEPKLSQQALSLALKSLLKKKKVVKKQGFYLLNGEKIKARKPNHQIKKFKEAVVNELISVAEKIPWVLGVVITGSYAAGVVEEKDDLDFLIITKKNRLWLTRLVFLLLAWGRGRRPQLPKGDLSHSWDFNFWLDESTLSLPAEKTGIYEAYEILQTRWVVNKDQVKERFFKANQWVYNYFLFAVFPDLKAIKPSTQKKIDWFWPIEFWLYKFQVSYRQLRHGQQNAFLHSAFFHSNSTKGEILAEWQRRYFQAIGIEKKVLVTGVFDVLHQEHINFLLAAKKYGTKLVIGLESDHRVRQLKGKNRPIFNQQQRKKNLEKLAIADKVFILPEKFNTKADHLRLIKKLKPAVLAVSSHTAHLKEKQAIMKEVGGELKIVYQHNPAVSSSKLINNSAG